MRNGKSLHNHVVQFKAVARLEQSPIEPRVHISAFEPGERRTFFAAPFGFERPKRRLLCLAIAINRQFQFPRQREQSANVIGMLVRDENAGKIFRRAANGREALSDLTGAESRVHEDAGFVGFHIGAIAGRTAAKNGEANSHG